MDRQLIRAALMKWAEKTDYAIADWAINQWLEELEQYEITDKELLLHMKYFVDIERPPHLVTLKKSIEQGLPDAYKRNLIPEEERENFALYMGMLGDAFGKYKNSDKWRQIREAQEFGKRVNPQPEWDREIRYAERMIDDWEKQEEGQSSREGDG